MRRNIALSTLLAFCAAFALGAAEQAQSDDEKLDLLIHTKKWDEANRQVLKIESAGQCSGSNCLAARALILNGQGHARGAEEAARQAGEKLGEGQALSAWRYNELAVLLYRQAGGKTETLRLAESAFRRAAATYRGRLSTIRFNLATVLESLGSKAEAKKLMDELEAEGGLLLDSSMSILGDYQGPGRR